MTATAPNSRSSGFWQQTWHAPVRWRRWAVRGLAGLLLLWLIGWLGLPPLLKSQIESRASDALGRAVTLQSVQVRPWSLEVDLVGLRMAGASADAAPVLTVDRLHVDAELQSLLRLAPVIDALRIERPVIHVSHLADGRYSVDDIVERIRAASPPPDPAAEPARFAVFNLEVQGGDLTFEDQPVGVTHRIEGVELGVPFLSNLPSSTPLRELVRLAKLRWRIERDYQDLKQEFGLGHFEGRSWRGFHHHASLCIAAYGFLMAERIAYGKKNFAASRLCKQPALPESYRPRGRSGAATPARLDTHTAITPDRSADPTPATLPMLR